MKLEIDESVLDSFNLTLDEFLYLLCKDREMNLEEIVESLEDKGAVIYSSGDIKIKKEWKENIGKILNESKEEVTTDMRLEDLAEKLMKIFPQGKKEGTPYYWKGNKKEIKDKLRKFFVYFGDKYTNREILNAAKKYVESFNGDYTFMRLLKYFIWKGGNGKGELVSELATYIENAGQEEDLRSDWTSTII